MPPLAAKTGQPGFARGKQANLAALELRQPLGLTVLGWQGSACDRLRLTGGLRAPALGSYKASLRWREVSALRVPFCNPLRSSVAFAAGRRHVYWRRRRRTSPTQWYYITPWAEPSTHPGGVSRSRIEPLALRARGPIAPSTLARVSGRQPSGIQPPAESRKSVTPFLSPHMI